MTAAEALADRYFSFPEHASWMCSVRVRNRLATLLAQDSPLLYRSEDAVVWLGVGSFFTLYAARSPEALAEIAPAGIAHLARQARADGATNSQIFATSAGAVAALESAGYHVQHRAQRLRHDAPGPREIDPRVSAYTPADLAGIVKVSQEVFPENHWSDEEWSHPVRNAAHVWVARDGDDIAAFLLADLTAERLFINGLAVAPAARRRGLASALVERAILSAHEHGRATVDVYANDTEEAMGCYARAGFHTMHPIWDLGRDW